MGNKNGFTLVELLAVIVVLGIIMVIAGSSVNAIKKNANISEAKEIEEMIESLGADVYINYQEGDYSIQDLYEKGYLKSKEIKNPSGGENCSGYLQITKTQEGPVFKAHICCPHLYETNNQQAPSSCSIK